MTKKEKTIITNAIKLNKELYEWHFNVDKDSKETKTALTRYSESRNLYYLLTGVFL